MGIVAGRTTFRTKVIGVYPGIVEIIATSNKILGREMRRMIRHLCDTREDKRN